MTSAMRRPSSNSSTGNRAFGVDRAEFRGELLAGAQIDLYGRQGDPFFRQEDADATRVRCELIIVELHRTVLCRVWSCMEPTNNLVPPERPLSEPAVINGLAARSRSFAPFRSSTKQLGEFRRIEVIPLRDATSAIGLRRCRTAKDLVRDTFLWDGRGDRMDIAGTPNAELV